MTTSTASIVPVHSEAIKMMVYDYTSQALTVSFADGGVYRYYDVHPDVFQTLRSIPSKGSGFNAVIRGKFRVERLS